MYQNIVHALPNKKDVIWNYQSEIIQKTSPYLSRFSVAKIRPAALRILLRGLNLKATYTYILKQ